MNKVYNAEALAERARNLGNRNGVKLVFVTLDPAATPTRAVLDLEFYNDNRLNDILNDVNTNGVPPTQVFPIVGGTRAKAGAGFGQVQVVAIAAGRSSANGDLISLKLTVQPIGDYSTYRLRVAYPRIDPIFNEIEFKFRPGCFNVNCAPTWTRAPAPAAEPVIDYLAKDYDSFKHVLLAAMQERVPDWAPTSEADLDQVLIDLVAADADESSDFQDRVVNEAYLATARKRVSLARHARLMDYHIHQGNQATTWLALKVAADVTVAPGFGAWTATAWQDANAVVFATQESRDCFASVNDLALYHWEGLVTALEVGATEADLKLPAPLDPTSQANADQLRDLFRSGAVPRLLIEQELNPETGTINGRDPRARQLLTLLEGTACAESVFDPAGGASGEWFVRVHWRDEDALTRRYCFLTKCTGQAPQESAALFHGNLVRAAQGRPHITVFRPADAVLGLANAGNFIATGEAHYEETKWGVVCAIPQASLAYRDTPPGGEGATKSTLEVRVSGFSGAWEEQSDLIESSGDDEHYIVETDELGTSRVRFGNDVNGCALPSASAVTCAYQVGQGVCGNVGADTIVGFRGQNRIEEASVEEIWNPFDVIDGRDAEPREEILRRAPEAYRERQLRAVTLEDYVKRAEELPQVAQAAARYAWTGSWRTVRVAIDPRGTTTLDDATRRQIEAHLDVVRLIGEDLEIREAEFVPLDINMVVCAHPQYWPADLDAVLQREFSDGYTPDGRQGFFHPDRWTFGQPLYASQLIGRALEVAGVERVVSVSIRRLHELIGPSLITITVKPEDVPQSFIEKLDVDAFEIIEVANDPSALERGRIQFDIRGGRR